MVVIDPIKTKKTEGQVYTLDKIKKSVKSVNLTPHFIAS
jgi:hypothetical protein